jgi:hypothetical protein
MRLRVWNWIQRYKSRHPVRLWCVLVLSPWLLGVLAFVPAFIARNTLVSEDLPGRVQIAMTIWYLLLLSLSLLIAVSVLACIVIIMIRNSTRRQSLVWWMVLVAAWLNLCGLGAVFH